MGLYERLIGERGSDKLAVNHFTALMTEVQKEAVTREQVMDVLDLDFVELQEFDDILDISDALPADRQFEFSRLVRDTLLLASRDLPPTTREDFFQRLQEFT